MSLLLESQLKQYLDGEAEMLTNMLGEENDRVKFARWKVAAAKPIEITSYNDIPEIVKFVESGTITYKIKQCYDNATWTALHNPQKVKYCEGIASYIFPMDHAWNSYDNKYFDLTSEVALTRHRKENEKGFSEYLQLIELSNSEVHEFTFTLGHSGPFTLAYFYKNVLKKWDKKTKKALRTVF